MLRNFLKIALLFVVVLTGRTIAADNAGRAFAVDGVIYSGDVAERDLRAAAGEFEAVRDAVRALDHKRGWRFPFAVRVHVVADATGYPSSAPIFTDGPLTRIIVVKFDDPDSRRSGLRNLAALMIDNELGPVAVPPWLRAGLLEYLSGAVFDPPRGKVPANSALTSPSIGAILDTDHFAFNRQTRETRSGFVARATALTAFLMRSTKGSLAELCSTLDAGLPVRVAFERVFGLDVEAIDRAASQSYPRLILRPVPFGGAIATYTSAAARLIDAEILLGIGEGQRAAALIDKTRPDAESFVLQGLAESSAGLFDQAEKSLTRASVVDPRNADAYFALSRMLISKETTEFGLSSSISVDVADRVRALLRRSIELAPDFGDSYALLAFVNAVREEQVSATIDLMKKALALAPGNPWYRMRMAELQVADRNFANARETVLAVRRTAGDDPLRIYAENTLTRMNSLETQLASLGRRNQKQSDVITDEPLSDEEIARRRAIATNESLNIALRIPGEGEERVIGTIDRVECGTNGASVSVRTGGERIILWNRSVENVVLVSYVDKLVNSEFGCGIAARQQTAVITFRKSSTANGADELISIEFVPSSFTFTKR